MRVDTSPIHDRGVFAERSFRKGEMIEECPLLVISAQEADNLDELANYIFECEDDYAVPLGLGCFYNHSRTANAETVIDPDGRTLTIIAARSIRRNEEITINYNGAPDDPTPLPFEDEVPNH
ncbi:MAG: SET domain-containing protein-lysine N-methyltransferase [Acidimicrobiales bacterium]|nr:SET domain-containing protein-lysine N-methyltransferase [Acidimicrobiales bacterium]